MISAYSFLRGLMAEFCELLLTLASMLSLLGIVISFLRLMSLAISGTGSAVVLSMKVSRSEKELAAPLYG